MYIILYNDGFTSERPFSELSNVELFDAFAKVSAPYMRAQEMRDLKKELKIAHLYKKGGSYEKK